MLLNGILILRVLERETNMNNFYDIEFSMHLLGRAKLSTSSISQLMVTIRVLSQGNKIAHMADKATEKRVTSQHLRK